jgi:Transglycosylase SLT domain
MPAPRKLRLRLHTRILLGVAAYVVGLNLVVRHYGGDAQPLSLFRLQEKTWAVFLLGVHSVKHVWSSRCDDPSPFVIDAARAEGIPTAFALAVARTESGFRSHSISSTGAMGVMQLMPRTARNHGVVDPFDPEQNARGGARYLADLWRRYHGNRTRVAAAYNAGSGGVPISGPMRVSANTLEYAARVVKHAREKLPVLLTKPIVITAKTPADNTPDW